MAHCFIWVSPIHGEEPYKAARETLTLILSGDDSGEEATSEDRIDAQRYGLTLTSRERNDLRFCVTGSDLDINRLRRCLKRKA